MVLLYDRQNYNHRAEDITISTCVRECFVNTIIIDQTIASDASGCNQRVIIVSLNPAMLIHCIIIIIIYTVHEYIYKICYNLLTCYVLYYIWNTMYTGALNSFGAYTNRIPVRL